MLRKNVQDGFTLVEMVVVLAVLAGLSQAWYAWVSQQREEAVVERTVRGLLEIDEALYAYRIDRDVWPGNITEIAPYLPGFQNLDATAGTGGVNGVGLPYSIAASGTGLEITTELLSESQARGVALAFPNTATIDLTTNEVTIGIPVPGLESSHAALVHRDGSLAMQGDLDLGGNDLVNVGEVTLGDLSFSSAAAIGNACTGTSLATSGDEVLCCVSGAWARCLAAGGGTVFYEGTIGGTGRPGAPKRYLNVPSGFAIDQCSLTLSNIPLGAKGRMSQWGYYIHESVVGGVYSSRTTDTANNRWEVKVHGPRAYNSGTGKWIYLYGSANYRIACNT